MQKVQKELRKRKEMWIIYCKRKTKKRENKPYIVY